MADILIAGLGNPGAEYELTRHNLGFIFADNIADDFRKSGKCAVLYSRLSGYTVIKPMTYMNRSGSAIKCFMDYFEITSERLLIVCDDFNLPLGKIRLRDSGSSGGHNGLQSVIDAIGTRDIARLRIGIGSCSLPDKKEYVLGKFNKRELKAVNDIMLDAHSIVDSYVNGGIEAAMTRYN